MVYIEPEFEPAHIPDSEKYEGTEVDPSIFSLLPKGSKVQWSSTHGSSFWAISHKITVELPSGKEKDYFLKLFLHERGKEMVQGEFEATKAWHNVVPENIPEPIGWGECTNRPGIFFLLLEFRDMVDEMPPVQDFVRVVAKAHRDSKSPTEKFGFHVTTFSGDHAFDNRWCDTWEEWFTRSMKAVMERELQVQGPHAELEQLEEQILDKVIPRLIRPMETEGRRIKPCIVHGDLWHGNVGVDNQTDDPVLYDCGSLYAHNEWEFGMWRAARYRTNKPHLRAYSYMGNISEPVEDQDDRNALYAAQRDLAVSFLWPQNKRMRILALDEFKRLVAKYPAGYEGYISNRECNGL